MRVCITTEQRFVCTPDGHFWAPTVASYAFWRRYLDVFDEAQVIARVANVSITEPSWRRADGEGVTFGVAPHYVGPLGYVQKYLKLRAAVRQMVSDGDALVMRVSSHIATCLESTLAPDRPFGLEIVGDPYEVFAPGSIDHPLRPFLRWWFTRTMKQQCRKAAAVAYVTAAVLQERYRPNQHAFKTSYSSVELPEEAYAESPRPFQGKPRQFHIIAVGSLEQMYKGFDVLIDAVSCCLRKGVELELEVVGDGRYRSVLERRVQAHGIGRNVIFAGHVSAGCSIRQHLDWAHLFVLPSKTEGLPRAMVEAMARGLPCIGSAVGGIPELLPPEDLVPRGDVSALVNKIIEVVRQPGRLTRMSETNLARSRDFHESALRPRRRLFLDHLLQTTQQWIRGRTIRCTS